VLITDSALTDSQGPVSRCCDRDVSFPVLSSATEQCTATCFENSAVLIRVVSVTTG